MNTKNIYSFLILSCLLLSIKVHCQLLDPVDFKHSIEIIVTDSTSKFYYPSLINKIRSNPAEIDSTDCFYLYYGQIFQEGYKALEFYSIPEYSYLYKAVENFKCKNILKYGSLFLEQKPINLYALINVCDCISMKDHFDTTYFFKLRLNNLLKAILSTGNGKTKETAIKIVNVEDDKILHYLLGLTEAEESFDFKDKHFYSVWTDNNQKLYFEDIMEK